VHDVLASLREGVKPDEKSISSDFPLPLCLLLVLKIGIFELGTDVEGNGKLVVGLLWLFSLDKVKDGETIYCISASDNDGVTDFSDKDDESGWGIVVLRILPDKQDRLHDWSKQINHFG